MTPDDALTLRIMIWANEELLAEYEASGWRAEAAFTRHRLEACTNKLAKIEAAAGADAKRGGDDNARFV